MKTIPLKSVAITRPDGTEMTLSYWAQIEQIMRAPRGGQQGAHIDEIRSSVRVLDALEKAGIEAASIDLEDADYEHLKEKILAAQFVFIDRAIADFVDAITSVK